ncbi:MAG: thioesterase family protein [Verrucomicrobiota bacterium]
MSEKTFQHTHRVTYAECTVGNHIYYARYLNLLEASRGEFFRSLEIPLSKLQGDGLIFPAIECHLRYKSPARYDDLLSIEVWLTKLHGVRMNFAYRVLNQHRSLLLESETLHVCTDLQEKLKRLPKELVERLVPYLRENKGD